MKINRRASGKALFGAACRKNHPHSTRGEDSPPGLSGETRFTRPERDERVRTHPYFIRLCKLLPEIVPFSSFRLMRYIILLCIAFPLSHLIHRCAPFQRIRVLLVVPVVIAPQTLVQIDINRPFYKRGYLKASLGIHEASGNSPVTMLSLRARTFDTFYFLPFR